MMCNRYHMTLPTSADLYQGNVFIWAHSPSLKILHFFSIFQIISWAFPKEETRKIWSSLYK